MKNIMTLILTVFAACSLLIACHNPMSVGEQQIGNGNGLITVTIGDANDRKAVKWANALDSNQLSHTITFSGGPGTAPPSQTIPAGGGTARFSVTPGQWTITAKAYYSGDVVAEGSNKAQINQGNNPTVTIQMRAPSVPLPSYTVTFDANGGLFGDNYEGVTSETQTVSKYNKAARPDPQPTRVGRYFVDWFTEKACTNKYNFNAPVTENKTLYAGWGYWDQ
jgi:uncharacterized repeat protein (TIGR02543 family)